MNTSIRPSSETAMTGNKMTIPGIWRGVIVIKLLSDELRAQERQFKKRINLKLLKKFRKLRVQTTLEVGRPLNGSRTSFFEVGSGQIKWSN